jgi:type IV pilus assembly protein PilW
VVVALAMGAAAAQQKLYYGSQMLRAAQGQARAAQMYLEDRLRTAGYGVDPSMAFDFQYYTPTGLLCPAATGCARDSTTQPDELVFYSRNPRYWVPATAGQPTRGNAWNLVSVTATQLTLDARAGDVFRMGQVLTLVCSGGQYYTHVTVGQTVTVPADQAGQVVPLAASVAANPFRQQDLALPPTAGVPSGDGCFSSGFARVFQLDRYRLHVRPVAQAQGKDVPYLALDMGVDLNGDQVVDESDELLIAEGVELMQVAYVLANPALATQAVGATAGTAITFTAGQPGANRANTLGTLSFPGAAPSDPSDSVYQPSSWFGYTIGPPADSQRLTDHQANIQAVRVTLLVRSPEPDLRARTPYRLDQNFSLFNLQYTSLAAVPAWLQGTPAPTDMDDGYQRVVVESRVTLPNMSARGMTFF